MWLQYALDKEDNLISIHDCPRGKSHLRCPYCQGALVAKKGKIKAHHFAHVSETCNPSQNREVNLPLFYGFNLILNSYHLEVLQRISSPTYQDFDFSSEKERRRESRIYRQFHELGIYEGNKLTPLGKAILKRLSLAEFVEAQEQLSHDKLIKLQDRLVSLEHSIKSTIEFQKTDYYQTKPW